jgi:flavorubredoxin
MEGLLKARKVNDQVYWVGAIDWNIRDFHGYSTEHGSTYNAYLILADKVTLIDTVKAPFKDEMLSRIASVIDPKEIAYVVSNHTEMDHSGCLPQALEAVQPEKVFASTMGVKNLAEHFFLSTEVTAVKDGESLSLGNMELSFLETRMIHWPDSMFSYLVEDKLLFSSDGFGQHWATSERFDHEVDPSELMRKSAKYYANILMLLSDRISKLLAKVGEMGIEIDTIAPDHGLIWSNPDDILQAYSRWSQQEAIDKALVVYDTMWHSTETMAVAIAEGLSQEGVSVQVMGLEENHRSDVVTELLDAKAVVLGSSTLNNGMLPRVADLLCYMKGLRPAGKLGAAFGSYGWSGEAVKLINEAMEEMKFEIVDGGVKSRFVPTQDDLGRCVELGREVARKIKEND